MDQGSMFCPLPERIQRFLSREGNPPFDFFAESINSRLIALKPKDPFNVDRELNLSKLRRQREQERHQTKGLMSRTIALHVRFESWSISRPSSAKQQREMTKFCVFWRT